MKTAKVSLKTNRNASSDVQTECSRHVVSIRNGVAERRRRSICVTAGETRRTCALHSLNPKVGSTPAGVVVRGDATTPSCASLRSACMGLRKFNACGVGVCSGEAERRRRKLGAVK
ncbi:MAG: hypothetical protein LBM61_03375 [Prevotellaceae bacterium]|nr:hypothetical protein [Prevotellaceae bacterium]